MRGVRVRVTFVLVALAAGVFAVSGLAETGSASDTDMCSPVTLDVLFPPEEHPDAPRFTSRNDDAATADAPTPVPEGVTVPSNCAPFVYDMLFPVAVDSPQISPFGAVRDGGARRHKGIDIAAPKLTPVVAVADATVVWIKDEQAGDCCALGLQHDDGWYSYYIHLNNDTLGTDDGLGFGIAPGVTDGARVTEGQVIGWVGDSGNAEETVPHLHFELRSPSRVAIDASPSLRAAARAQSDAVSTSGVSSLFSTASLNFGGAYLDDDHSIQVRSIDLLASLGVLDGCDDAGLVFCPTAPATGDTIATWLARAYPETEGPGTVDFGDASRLAEERLLQNLAATTSIEELRGCGERRLCAEMPLTRGEFAALVSTMLAPELSDGGETLDAFADDDGHRFEAAINRLAAAGIADGCTHPNTPAFHPDRLLTRAAAAEYLSRMLGFESAPSCVAFD